MARAFAAKAGLLDAAEGGNFGGDQAGVHAHHPVFQRFLDAGDAAYVAGVEVRGKAEDRVIGLGNHLFLGLETEQGGEGAEGFFLADQHVLGHARNDGGFKE